MEVQLTEEEKKKAFSEAPVWARMLFGQTSKVTEEISDVKEQLKVINDEFNSKLADVVARTDIIDVKVQGQEIRHEALEREVEASSDSMKSSVTISEMQASRWMSLSNTADETASYLQASKKTRTLVEKTLTKSS